MSGGKPALWIAASVFVLSLIGLVILVADQFPDEPPAPPRPRYEGAALVVERFQCYRCHDAPGKLVPARREKHCVHCHQAIHAGSFEGEYSAETSAGWRTRNVHLRLVPSLVGVESRFRREWLIGFLQAPHDLRPGLEAEMPRLAIGPEEARAIADHFIPERGVDEATSLGGSLAGGALAGGALAGGSPAGASPAGNGERGRILFRGQDCARCHHFSGAGVEGPPAPAPGAQDEVRLAPDLRHTRARMSEGAVLAWLRDPKALKADTLMPVFPLSEEERRDLAAFVLRAELAPALSLPVPERLPVLERAVRYAEVEERVFKKVCWHCHSDPLPVGGDGGPGNTGGFGFEGKGLDLGSYAAIKRGARDASGAVIDVLAPDARGVSLLVAAMLARHAEVAGEGPGPVRGMPLGLPPMSAEEIQLVETWIAQGAPE